jgi:hypothetical protein
VVDLTSLPRKKTRSSEVTTLEDPSTDGQALKRLRIMTMDGMGITRQRNGNLHIGWSNSRALSTVQELHSAVAPIMDSMRPSHALPRASRGSRPPHTSRSVPPTLKLNPNVDVSVSNLSIPPPRGAVSTRSESVC